MTVNCFRSVARRMAAIALLTLAASSAHAACWRDAALTQRAQQHAQNGFPATANNLPQIVVCHDYDFPPKVSGDYNGGSHLIRIPQHEFQTGRLDLTIRHELGHSEAHLTGQDDGSHGGHGPGWLRVMQQAGEHREAQRLAEMTGQSPRGADPCAYGGCGGFAGQQPNGGYMGQGQGQGQGQGFAQDPGQAQQGGGFTQGLLQGLVQGLIDRHAQRRGQGQARIQDQGQGQSELMCRDRQVQVVTGYNQYGQPLVTMQTQRQCWQRR